jgi:putative endonuclease
VTIQKQGAPERAQTAAGARPSTTTKQLGDAAEQAALAYLQRQGLYLLQRNFKTPGRGGGEIDLIMRQGDGTLVFVEVRQRSGAAHGGAGGSIGVAKQRRIVFAARHYLARWPQWPPCRFDAVLVHGRLEDGSAELEWLQGAFDASGWA